MIGSASSLNNPSAIIRYRDPYVCLDFRIQVQRVLERTPKLSILFNGIDITAILEAVARRGGSRLLGKRIKEVQLSLPYYDPSIIKHAISILQNKIQQQFHELLAQTTVISQPFIQEHLLPISSGLLYYEMSSHQRYFMQQNFTHLDEYFCIKTLAYFGANITRLDPVYYTKYYKMRRWLYLNDYIFKLTQEQLKQISLSSQTKICIVGISVANIILARKLSNLGLTVRILDFSASEIGKWVEGHIPDIIKQGVFVSNDAEVRKIDALLQQHMGLTVNCLFKNQKPAVDQNLKSQNHRAQDQTSQMDKYEEIFVTFLEEIFRDYPINSEKLMWDELNLKVAYFNNNGDPRYRAKYRIYQRVQPSILKAYYDRLIHLNKIKNSKTTTVADLHKFITSSYSSNTQARTNKMRMALKYSTYNIRYQKLKQGKYDKLFKLQDDHFSIQRKSVIDKLEKVQNKWKISLRGIKSTDYLVEEFDYLIYGVCRSVKESELILGPLNSLFAFSSIHCLYRCKQKISFRSIENKNEAHPQNSYSYFSSQFGIIHFYLMGNSDEVLACLNYNNTSVDHYKEIGLILNTNVLKKPTKFELPMHQTNQYSTLCTYYCTQQEEQAETLATSKQQQNIYLNPALTKPALNGNILTNSLHINNSIACRMLDRLNARLNLDTSLMQEEQQQQQMEEQKQDRVIVEQKADVLIHPDSGMDEQNDWFGLECGLVTEWQCILSKLLAQIERYHSDDEGSAPMIPTLQISWPVPIQTSTPPTTLVNIGLPYHQDNTLHLLYFTSIRISASLVYADKTAILYQTCIMYNQQIIYCIVQLEKQQNGYGVKLVLFHNRLKTLMETVGSYAHGRGRSAIPNTHDNTMGMNYYICPSALVDHIRQSVQMQRTYTEILNNRIRQLEQHQYKDIPSVVGIPNPHHIYHHACDLIRYYCRLYCIREYSLAEILIGRLNLQYISWEISAFYGENSENNEDQTSNCLLLLKQLIIQQVKNKYRLKIEAGICSRRFIQLNNIDGNCYQQYAFYTYNHPPNTAKSHELQNWTKQIINSLIINQMPCQQIIHELHQLIQGQIQPIVQIINMKQSLMDREATLSNYILMTRLAPVSSIQEDKQQRYSKIKEVLCNSGQLTNDEQSQLQQMVQEQDIVTYGSEFIMAYSEL